MTEEPAYVGGEELTAEILSSGGLEKIDSPMKA